MRGSGASVQNRSGRQRVAVGLALALILVPPFGWPWLSAWWRFPAPPAETFRAALLAEATELRFVTAFDADGRARTLVATAIAGIAPGPCSRWYQPDDRDRGGARGPRPFGAGMVEFTCLADLTAAGHGPLRAVVGLRLYTRPAPDGPPRANILPDGPLARDWLVRLEARRQAGRDPPRGPGTPAATRPRRPAAVRARQPSRRRSAPRCLSRCGQNRGRRPHQGLARRRRDAFYGRNLPKESG